MDEMEEIFKKTRPAGCTSILRALTAAPLPVPALLVLRRRTELAQRATRSTSRHEQRLLQKRFRPAPVPPCALRRGRLSSRPGRGLHLARAGRFVGLYGHGAPQLATRPPLHDVSPAAHSEKPQPLPALPRGQSSRHAAPGAHSTWQFSSRHVKRQVLPVSQRQVPLLQSPSQLGLLPSQRTWHGPALQANEQLAPGAHSQSPFAHTPLQLEPGAQLTWHGGLWQAKAQSLFGPQPHSPLPQTASQRGLSPAH